MQLHAVIIKKPIILEKAREIANDYMDTNKKKFFRETSTSYRFRNIPKTRFNSFISKKINDRVTLIFGSPKIKTNDDLNIIGGGVMDDIQNFFLKYNPISLVAKSLMSGAKQDMRNKGYFQKSKL
jgi:hypothetical protein